jgi:hypothetical protein
VLSRHRVENPEIAPQQYAVVLVDEAQLDQLMRRPAMRRVNAGYGPQDVYARYQRLKRRTAAAAVLLLVLATGGFFYFVAPQPAMASMFPWSASSAIPTLPTGASFSVTIATLDSADGATGAAARVRGLGLPAFTRRSPGRRQVHQAMVGPYASLDEAEGAQRRLSGMGYRGARLFVDESLRSAPRGDGRARVQSNPSVALLAAPERLSLVLELESEPRQVKSSRPGPSTVEIDAGPMATAAHPQHWAAPDGVHLLQTVAIEGHEAAGGLHYVRARVTLPEFAKANVRTAGRRLYVDITWPLADEETRAPRQASTAASRSEATAPEPMTPASKPVSAARLEEEYRVAIAPVRERATSVQPFLLSAVQSGSAEVLAAMDQTLADLEATLVAMQVPAAEADQHQLLLSAARIARRGLEPGFTGDRLAHTRQAIAMFEGALAPSTIPSAP